jgi:hypothetical protein
VSGAWDEPAWAALAGELDRWAEAGRAATFWWRDDDAGPPHAGLERLLALARVAAVPVGLAVVPAWLEPGTAGLVKEHGQEVTVLQHGWAHQNHEPAAPPSAAKVKPAELGAGRPHAVVLDELRRGRETLEVALGPVEVLVPPWNRVAPAVAGALAQMGYRGLSVFGPRPPESRSGPLVQVNCHVDPIVWREAKRFLGAAPTLDRLRAHLAARRSGATDPGEPTGLLTHHRDMSEDFWTFLEMLLRRLRAHPAARFPPVPRLFDGRP